MKNIFITGGSKGIGKELVRAFAHKGQQVFFTYQYSVAGAEALVAELKAAGFENVQAFKCDMGNEEEVKQLFKTNRELLKDIDVLINNAGIRDSKLNANPKPFIMTSSKEWWEVMHNNINGVMNTCRAVLPAMIKKRSGRIINVTSLAGIKGNPGQSAYASSKAAINCFSKSLSKEVSGMGVTINCVAPGFIETEMVENLPDKYINDRVGHSLLKRLGTTAEISNLITYLALEAPGFLINQEIVIDGGMN
ncbi:SDR family NAD(P)-dependent oxidoreductase [Chitinophaga vietnamensis]|uniref:SDR family NAD(P)-dependent oxidoreductase n=1 Tax=Chitinophaga vietnamensis TaxID=2593957 RepID=UPI001376352F|nr:SDR family NAD(P)-dependent oxidoreductase [Chitinophaga vietnamensis]